MWLCTRSTSKGSRTRRQLSEGFPGGGGGGVVAAGRAAAEAIRVGVAATQAEAAVIPAAGVAGDGASAGGSSIDGKKIMEEIATRTGGRFFEAKKKDNLEEIYNPIAEELRGQYLLSYTPDKPDNDDGVPQDCAEGEEWRI